MNNFSILIADDHPLLLKGLEIFLTEKKYNVIAKEKDGRSALNSIIKYNPQIAILDLEMPKMTGIEVVKECKRRQLKTKFVLNTFHKDIKYYLAARKLNVDGYLLKDFALDEIENCLEAIKKGGRYFSKEIQKALAFTEESSFVLERLSLCELKILKLVAFYKTNKQISDTLLISCRTVEKHRSNIIAKLQLPQRTGTLLIWAQQNRHILIA